MTQAKVDEGQQIVDDAAKKAAAEAAEQAGKHPETVPWSQYVGVKEMLTKSEKTETELKTKVSDLEEQAKKAVNTEQHEGIKTELTEAKTKLQTATDELKTNKETALAEKRDILIKKGNVPEEEAKAMSEEQVNGAIKVLASFKPKADMDTGTSTDTPTGGKSKMKSGFETLHPSK